ncbi:MAG: ABC transporter ATP-binding protein [Clostridia bacterium]|nr:ABC transporter ATP-binding protein [Clostridia bacterium]
MSEQLLKIENLVVEYTMEEETVHAVNNISLSLNKGETLGLVGETGAGKTTTALSIMRLLPDRVGKIQGGKILFKGEDLLELKESDMRAIRGEDIAMIYQDPMTSLNPVLTVGNQIYEALLLHKKQSKEEMEARVDEILELVGIPKERKVEYPHQFSGGMKQRVVIAMALACEPELLIADEPTTALDVTIQSQVLKMIFKLRDQMDMAMLLITHDLGVVAQTCNKVAVMYAGEIVEYGPIEDIFKGDCHHPYTDGLFGSIPKLNEETRRLKAIEGSLPDPTNLPEGCKFAPRCQYCTERCLKENPAMHVGSSENHFVKCHLRGGENA